MTIRFPQTDTTLATIGQGKENREYPSPALANIQNNKSPLKCNIHLRIKIAVRYNDEWVGTRDQWSRRACRSFVCFLANLYPAAVRLVCNLRVRA